MYETYPKGKKPGKEERGKQEELSSPHRARTTITDSEEKRTEQVYGNYYGKQARKERPEHQGRVVNPLKTTISIG